MIFRSLHWVSKCCFHSTQKRTSQDSHGPGVTTVQAETMNSSNSTWNATFTKNVKTAKMNLAVGIRLLTVKVPSHMKTGVILTSHGRRQ